MDPKSGHIFKRKGSANWQLRAYVPADVQAAYGRPEKFESLRTSDWTKATIAAGAVMQKLECEWDELRGRTLASTLPLPAHTPSESELLAIAEKIFQLANKRSREARGQRYDSDPSSYADYLTNREKKLAGWVFAADRNNFAPWADAAADMLARRGYAVDRDSEWFQNFAGMIAEVMIANEDISNRRDRGDRAAKPASEVLERAAALAADEAAGRKNEPFSELVKAYLRQWKAGMSGAKETNTEQQKKATYKLFGGFWENKPIRGVKAEHAAEFRDKIKLLDPNWSRSPAARELAWGELIARFGDRPKGLSDATMNRHMAALQSLWAWASKRGHCSGDNPFDGFHVKLREGVNTAPYVPWENDELKALFSPPPKRSDLTEAMIVALYTGMRLDEIASLTWGRVRTEGFGEAAVTYFNVADAKTPAGIRQVPVHEKLAWLLSRTRGSVDERIWPKFNPEGPGQKAGADAGRDFSTFKIKRGFQDRRKAFHSFRKNVTRIMERAGVPENEWAQVFGHERGFTYRTYNPDGITLVRKAEIIGLIAYPGVEIPHPIG